MGTSGRSDGPSTGTPLVPSWLEDTTIAEPPPALGEERPPDQVVPQEVPQIPVPPRQPLPAIPPAPPPDRFRRARTNFTRFASSGGSNTRALRRAVGDYVRSGTGGSRNATRRMAVQRASANVVLGLIRDIQRDGVPATLRRLNLEALSGRPLEEVFTGLTEVVCGDGGTIDEGIAFDAWLETIAALGPLGGADPAVLTPEQMREIFLAFVARSIEGRLLQDLGANGLKVARDVVAIEAFEEQLGDYIQGSVRDSFAGDLSDPASLTNRQIKDLVDRTYLDAWELLLTLGDAEQ